MTDEKTDFIDISIFVEKRKKRGEEGSELETYECLEKKGETIKMAADSSFLSLLPCRNSKPQTNITQLSKLEDIGGHVTKSILKAITRD